MTTIQGSVKDKRMFRARSMDTVGTIPLEGMAFEDKDLTSPVPNPFDSTHHHEMSDVFSTDDLRSIISDMDQTMSDLRSSASTYGIDTIVNSGRDLNPQLSFREWLKTSDRSFSTSKRMLEIIAGGSSRFGRTQRRMSDMSCDDMVLDARRPSMMGSQLRLIQGSLGTIDMQYTLDHDDSDDDSDDDEDLLSHMFQFQSRRNKSGASVTMSGRSLVGSARISGRSLVGSARILEDTEFDDDLTPEDIDRLLKAADGFKYPRMPSLNRRGSAEWTAGVPTSHFDPLIHSDCSKDVPTVDSNCFRDVPRVEDLQYSPLNFLSEVSPSSGNNSQQINRVSIESNISPSYSEGETSEGEASASSSCNSPQRGNGAQQGNSDIEPKCTDILLGRGGKANNHPGNCKYRLEVDSHRQSYKTTGIRKEKQQIVKDVIDKLTSDGTRFFEKKNGKWEVAPAERVTKKVGQALREKEKL